ncbi:hypothetical protein [Sorangium sp. So ce117]|uniref:hypothetical protein n=1 Tax=Sorangium sp. So ce117 TaxID=3133277 RepID=UPI003F5F13A8
MRLEADDDQGRERLVRYCARPCFALDRLSLLPDGRVAYRVQYEGRGGTHRVMTPVPKRASPGPVPPRAERTSAPGGAAAPFGLQTFSSPPLAAAPAGPAVMPAACCAVAAAAGGWREWALAFAKAFGPPTHRSHVRRTARSAAASHEAGRSCAPIGSSRIAARRFFD